MGITMSELFELMLGGLSQKRIPRLPRFTLNWHCARRPHSTVSRVSSKSSSASPGKSTGSESEVRDGGKKERDSV